MQKLSKCYYLYVKLATLIFGRYLVLYFSNVKYQVWDPNPYAEAYLKTVDPETNKKHERCDLPFHRELTKKEKEIKKEEEMDKSYIAYYSVLF